MQGASVTLNVQLGRWRCRSRQCLRQIFTERVDGVLLPYSQQTNRWSEVHRLVGRALGGRSGQRLLKRLGMFESAHAAPSGHQGGKWFCLATHDPVVPEAQYHQYHRSTFVGAWPWWYSRRLCRRDTTHARCFIAFRKQGVLSLNQGFDLI
jgi:hypothetical protein